jgi:hypothetical protein
MYTNTGESMPGEDLACGSRHARRPGIVRNRACARPDGQRCVGRILCLILPRGQEDL